MNCPSCDACLQVVAEACSLKPEDVLSRSRSARLVYARHVAMFLAREAEPDHTLYEIAEHFGGLHSTGVLYAVNKIGASMDKWPGFKESVEAHALAVRFRLGRLEAQQVERKIAAE